MIFDLKNKCKSLEWKHSRANLILASFELMALDPRMNLLGKLNLALELYFSNVYRLPIEHIVISMNEGLREEARARDVT